MKKLLATTFVLIAIAVVISGKTVSALGTLVTYKEVPLTIVVLAASPTPVAFTAPAQRVAALEHNDGIQVAAISSYDVPMGILRPQVIEQSTTQQGAVPVKFTTKPDPTATYLHEVPINPTITAAAGQTTNVACPFEMYAYYKTPYQVTDWGYGTTTTASAGTFPLLNYPSTSDLAWNVTAVGVTPAPTASYTPYAVSGSPGQLSFTGTAGEVQTQCLNIQVTVPLTIVPGTYQAVIQYNLYSE